MPAWVVTAAVATVAAGVAVGIGYVSRAGDDNCAVAVTVVGAWVVVGEVAACHGNADYSEYDCCY